MHPAKLAGTAYRNWPCHTGRATSRAQHPDAVLASERAKEGADVLGQQLWLLKRRKVATPGHHRPLFEVTKAFGPLPWRLADLVRKEGYGTGYIDALPGLENPGVMLIIVVQPGRGVDRLSDPVDGDGGEQFVLGEASFHLPTAVAPGTPLLDNPGRQP